MITITKNISIDGVHQKPIITDVFYKKNDIKKTVVIFCHGYKGFKDWGAWDLVGEQFALNDTFFIKFNFSHNGGTKEIPIDFPDLEAFGNNNYSKELDDLQSVIDWVIGENLYKDDININKIILIGHSRGGGIVNLKASEEQRITKVITWAGVSDYGSRFPVEKALQEWKDKKVMYVKNGRTLQEMPHYIQFYEDFKKNEERLTISKAVKTQKKPYLIIHGTEDKAVLKSEANLLHNWSLESELFLLEGANHVFGAKHPWLETKLPEHLRCITEKSITFAKN